MITKTLGTIALGFLIVAQTCSTEDCGRSKDCKIDVFTTVSEGQTVDIGRTVSDVAQCSTCDHAVLRVRWQLQDFTAVTGSLRLAFSGSCAGAPPLQGIVRNIAPTNFTETIDHNVKNFCPETARWDAEFTNNSNVRLTLNSMEIDCPRKVEEAFRFLRPTRTK